MGPKTKELIDTLEMLISLLESDNEQHWSEWLKKSKSRIANSDFSGVELLLSAYGGMGSFNDLIICQPKGLGVLEFSESGIRKNDQLNKLREEVWILADYIKRDQQ